MTSPPLIVTLDMDEASLARLDGLRRQHFPPALNLIPAHLTLFHKLPGGEVDAVMADLGQACRHRPPMTLTISGPRLLGRGVALDVEPGPLAPLRRHLAARWERWLGAQDRQAFRPHVTVQNKVTPAVAKSLHQQLAASLGRFTVEGTGLLLWRYVDGPWERLAAVPFGGPA